VNEAEEEEYLRGSQAAWHRVLQMALRELGVEDALAGQTLWVSERVATVAMLRDLCRSRGDNDWPDDLHLADVIEKHLFRHMEAEINAHDR
jgi:hypothetical protein